MLLICQICKEPVKAGDVHEECVEIYNRKMSRMALLKASKRRIANRIATATAKAGHASPKGMTESG